MRSKFQGKKKRIQESMRQEEGLDPRKKADSQLHLSKTIKRANL